MNSERLIDTELKPKDIEHEAEAADTEIKPEGLAQPMPVARATGLRAQQSQRPEGPTQFKRAVRVATRLVSALRAADSQTG